MSANGSARAVPFSLPHSRCSAECSGSFRHQRWVRGRVAGDGGVVVAAVKQ